MQTFFITVGAVGAVGAVDGVGAVVASSLLWMMTNWFDINNVAAVGMIPDSVKCSFYAGDSIFLMTVL